jgi:hypothetical protein
VRLANGIAAGPSAARKHFFLKKEAKTLAH